MSTEKILLQGLSELEFYDDLVYKLKTNKQEMLQYVTNAPRRPHKLTFAPECDLDLWQGIPSLASKYFIYQALPFFEVW